MAPDPVAAGRRPEAVLARRGGKVELLRLPALAFACAARMRAALYDRGWLPTERLEVPVVSVGNLTVGGTGKTPMVIWLARRLARRGRRPGLLSRGYGAQAADSGEARRENDEARLFARQLPDVPRVQDPRRARGGRQLVEVGCDVVLLDDGFQHRRLRRDLDLVLVDALRPWGLPREAEGKSVRALLPRGLLREPPAALRRADAIVLTRVDQVEPEALERLERELEELAPGPAILHACHRPSGLQRPDGGEHPAALRGRAVDLVSGVGNPDAFEATVRGLGAEVVTHRRLADHHAYRPEDLEGLGAEGRWVVTTEKDAVKIEPWPAALAVLTVELDLVRGAGVLDALLGALPPGRRRLERRSLHEGLHG